jgi:MAPEG family
MSPLPFAFWCPFALGCRSRAVARGWWLARRFRTGRPNLTKISPEDAPDDEGRGSTATGPETFVPIRHVLTCSPSANALGILSSLRGDAESAIATRVPSTPSLHRSTHLPLPAGLLLAGLRGRGSQYSLTHLQGLREQLWLTLLSHTMFLLPFTLYLLFLQARVVAIRATTTTNLGDRLSANREGGKDPMDPLDSDPLYLATRCHQNYLENIPMAVC